MLSASFSIGFCYLFAFASGNDYVRDFSAFLARNRNTKLSGNCSGQLQKYSEDLSDNKLWALQMFDATSKLQSGILMGNKANYGAFTECLSIQKETVHDTITGKYCLGTLGLPQNFINDTLTREESERMSLAGLSWAICLPSTCTADEMNLMMPGFFPQNVTVTFNEGMCQTMEDARPALTTEAIVTICILLVLVLIALLSTLYDIYLLMYEKKLIHPILTAFSVYTNGKKLFSVSAANPDHLTCLNGLRFITIMWIVLIHTHTIYNNGPVFNGSDWIDWLNSPYTMYLAGGNVSVDTYFVMGGLVLSYTFLKARDKKVPFNLGKYYFHRYIRLTPALGVVVLVSANLLQYLGSGPIYSYAVTSFQEPCKEYWWSTVLYIQNYVNMNHFCIGQTWYLMVDTQLYLLSPLLLFPLTKWPLHTLGAIAAGVLAGIGVSFYLAWEYQLPALVTASLYGDKDAYMSRYYLTTYGRFAPWLIGIALGHLVWRQKQKKTGLKLNKWLVSVLWAVSLAVLATCVFAGHDTLRDPEYDEWGNAFHIALVRVAWSVALSWLIFACIFERGGIVNAILSWWMFQVLERLTYSIYLVHVTMLFVMTFSRKAPGIFSDYEMTLQFWGNLVFSGAMAVVLIVVIEYPVITLEKILFSIKIRKDNKITPVV